MNPQDFDRITEHVISKVAAWWKPYNDDVIDALIEDLAPFDNITLQVAMKKLRKTCKNQPRISQIIEACEEMTKTKESGRVGTYEDIQAAKRPKEHELREILSTPIGRLAAEAGCMRDMWLEALEGKKDFTEKDIARWNASKAEGIRLMLEHPAKQSPEYRACEKLWYGMQKQSEDLARKYAA